MGAILAGIGIKDYCYAAVIAAVIGAFTWYTIHERNIGADEALAPVAVIAHKAEVQVAVGTAIAKSTEKDNGIDYVTALAAPAVPDTGLVCHSGAGSREVPQADASSAPGADRQAPDSGGFDPSGPVLTDARDADAQIAYLQGRVIELESQMNSSP